MSAMTYTMVCTALAFGMGLALGGIVGRSASLLVWLAATGACLAVALLARRWWRVSMMAALVAVGLLGIVRVASVTPFPRWLSLRVPELHALTGTVVSYPEIGADRIGFIFEPDSLPGSLDVTWYEPPTVIGAVHRGDRVKIVGRARNPEAFDGFDYPAYLARRGIFATMTIESEEGLHVLTRSSSLAGIGDRIRQAIIGKLDDCLLPDVVAMAQSLLFGDRSALPEDLETAFSRTGLMHILAVSGLHLGIFLAGIWWILRVLGLRPRIAYPLVGVVVLGVLWIVGPRVSLVRAALLFAFLGVGSVLADLGIILRRSVRPVNGLAAASIAILAIHPGALFEAGFQLTIAATASILIAFSKEQGWATRLLNGPAKMDGLSRLRSSLRRLFLVTLAAQAGATPVIAWHFATIHPIALLANMIVVPLAGAALWCGLVGLPLLALGGGMGWALLPLGGLLHALGSIVQAVARIPFSEIGVPRWMALWSGGLTAFAVLAGAYLSSDASFSDALSCTSKSISMAPDPLRSARGGEKRPPRSA